MASQPIKEREVTSARFHAAILVHGISLPAVINSHTPAFRCVLLTFPIQVLKVIHIESGSYVHVPLQNVVCFHTDDF